MALLIGLSCVRKSRNVRLLPPPAHTGLTPLAHLRDLKSDNNFRICMAGYDYNGIWSAARALLAVNSERASRRRRRRKPTQPSWQVRQGIEANDGALPGCGFCSDNISNTTCTNAYITCTNKIAAHSKSTLCPISLCCFR